MYQPLLQPRLSFACLSLPPRRAQSQPPLPDETLREMPVRSQRFVDAVNAALKVVAPLFADAWFVDANAAYGMALCNIHIPERSRTGDYKWSLSSSPGISVMFDPTTIPSVNVNSHHISGRGNVEMEEIAASIRRELSERGGYSVAEPHHAG